MKENSHRALSISEREERSKRTQRHEDKNSEHNKKLKGLERLRECVTVS